MSDRTYDILSAIEWAVNRCCVPLSSRKARRESLLLHTSLPHDPKVSFCTTCMGRLHHLKKTFLQNLEDNRDHAPVEFVLLNYNSSDDMDGWVRRSCSDGLASGRVKYFRTEEPKYFHMSHAKNVAHCLASGDIVCNLDADQFTGPGFARFLAATFKADKALVVHGDWKARKSLSGRLAVLKEYFMLAGGYDERMQGWGFEELDLIRRLNNLGLEDVLLTEARFLETIDHADEERVRNFPPQFQGMVASHRRNRILSWAHLLTTKANQGVSWGQARIAGVL